MKPLQDGRVSVASLTIRHSLSWLWPSVVQTFRQIFQNWNKLQKEREHRVYSAEQGRHITVQCHAVTCPSKEWWQTDFTCKDVCSWVATPSCSVGAGTELLPALVCSWPHSSHYQAASGAPTTLAMWGSGASREHAPVLLSNLLVLSFWKSSLTCLDLSTLCLQNEWQQKLPQRFVGRVQKKNHRVSRTVLINGSHHKKLLLRECPEQGILTITWETYGFLGCGW